MSSLSLHELHAQIGGVFGEQSGAEVVLNYANPAAEHAALHTSAAAFDLGFRSRVCVIGADRVKFLNGQVTNNVAALKTGEGCYATLVNAKGKVQSDFNIFALADELLLDCEPGLTRAVTERLEKYVIADDAQMIEAAPHYGLLSVQGPRAAEAVALLGLETEPPKIPRSIAAINDATLGTLYLANLPRTGTAGFDLYVPAASLAAVFDKLIAATRAVGGCAAGWQALETARIEAGIPRFGADFDETNLPSEAGLDATAVSYSKGCYIGQEIIARLRTYGHVAKALRGLRLADHANALPARGDKILKDGKEVGYVTSAVDSPTLHARLALGYVRREANEIGAELTVRSASGECAARIVTLPFQG